MTDAAAAISAGMLRHSRGRSERMGGARTRSDVEPSAGRGGGEMAEISAEGWTRRRGAGRRRISEGRRQSSGRDAGDAAPRTPSGRPPTAGRECSGRRRTRRTAPREPSLGPVRRGMASPCRADSRRPARPNGMQARHPGSGGGAAPIGARERGAGRGRGRVSAGASRRRCRGVPRGECRVGLGGGTAGHRGTVQLRRWDHARDGDLSGSPRRLSGS